MGFKAIMLREFDLTMILLNIMFLVWFATMYAVFTKGKKNNETSLKYKIFIGLIFSSVSILILSFPFQDIDGFIFDSWSVFISLSALYLGFIPTIIIGLATMIYRVFIAGEGLILGLILIFISTLIGLLWKTYFKRDQSKWYKKLAFAIIPQWFSFILIILWDINLFSDYLLSLFIFFVILLPLVSFVMQYVLDKFSKNLTLDNQIKKQRKLLQVAVDSPKTMEIYVLDKNYNYLLFNSYHAYCMKLYYGVDIEEGDSFLEYIKNSEMFSRFSSQLSKALKGIEYTTVDEVETTRGKYYESIFTPIRDDYNEVIGVGVFSYDVTEKKQSEINLKYINYHDVLTDAYNRRFYNEKMVEYNTYENYPLCLILFDVNSLKTVNDAFGHTAGDKMLIKTTKVLKQTLKGDGFVARIGGDEFVAVIKNMNQTNAQALIEEINTNMSQESIEGVKLSVSVGYEIIEKSVDIDKAFKKAEDNMYRNKLFNRSTEKNDTINTIMKSLYEKNPREENHSQRVSKYAVMIGKALKLSKDRINSLKIASVLHDIGKIAIDDRILDKPGKLTDDEYEEIKKHPEIGYRILSTSTQYLDIAKDVLHHHERYDGKGYPRGLKAEDIPMNSRIISVADAYDAMTFSRPYKASLSKEEALKEIKDCSGTQFDKHVAKVFIKIMEEKKVEGK